MPLNLVQDRRGPSVWDRTSTKWDTERWLTAMSAAGLLFASVRGRSATGMLLLAGSAALAYWASTAAETRRERRTRLRMVWPLRRAKVDPVGEASEESFPASDAPALTPPDAVTR